MDSPADGQRTIAGRYLLLAVIGHGAMGTVWSAYDEFLHRGVAVKEVRLPPGFPAQQAVELRERALREARAIASLSHPNVITLYDVVREGDEPFVVMELFTARSLDGLIADSGPLDTERAAAIGDAVAAALEAAHAAGITHRDVKPANVLVSADGRIKLSDFGIARNVSELSITSSGIMLGSPAYMAPEIASGKKAGPAADLWSLGATLFAATEGRPPYDADGDPLETAHAVVDAEVPPPSPGPLAGVISALMTKEPSARPSPAEVRVALHDLAPRPGKPLFPAPLFERAHDTGRPRPVPGAERAPDPDSTASLAGDPGPLPFAPAAGRAARPRGAIATTAVSLLAALLFAVAAAGGFAAARVLAGTDVLPAPEVAPAPEVTPEQPRFEIEHGDATALAGDELGGFSIAIPADWSAFVSQQPAATLPSSTLVQYVSPDGRHLASVQRFPQYFESHPLDGYLKGLRESWPDGDFIVVTPRADSDKNIVTYRTVETGRIRDGGTTAPPLPGSGSRSVIGRTTFAKLVRDDVSLWVVRVTVPTGQEDRARTQLFDRIAPTFKREQ